MPEILKLVSKDESKGIVYNWTLGYCAQGANSHKMCLGAYGVVTAVNGDVAFVDFGGVRKEVLIAAEDVKVGSYVVVHAGVIISTMDEETFEESMREIESLVSEFDDSLENKPKLRELLEGKAADG